MDLFKTRVSAMKRTVILDCDEVLVETSPRAVELMHAPEVRDFYGKFLRLSDDFNLAQMTPLINSRPIYYLNEWLMRKEVSDELYEDYQEQLIPHMLDLFSRDDFYTGLQPTRLGATVARMLRAGTINRAIIISKVTKYDSAGIASKERFLKSLFSGLMERVDIYYLPATGDSKKSDVVNSLSEPVRQDVAFFADDHIENIKDMVENTDLTDYQLLVPSYGYNSNISSLDQPLLREKRAELLFYSPTAED